MTDPRILEPLAGLEFAKMNGTGNDFILVDNRDGRVAPEVMYLLARAVCRRGLSVGADGLILLRGSDRVDEELGKVDFAWDFFNADGSSAEMCGNGGRCAARFAHDKGLAGDSMVFDTLAGLIRAWVQGATVKLEMVRPRDAYSGLNLEAGQWSVILEGVNTGVPHAVLRVDDLEAAPVRELGRLLRYHDHFAPAGSNVNFAIRSGDELMVRTYERGVEDETLACGTGAVAAALTAGRGLGLASPVTVRVRSGETLKVYFNGSDLEPGEVFLEGEARYAYRGVLDREAFGWLIYE